METFVGILAIGNEVVEGQILNKNAAWLSEQICRMGASPLYHLTCRDEDQEIKSSLNFLVQHCHLIVVCGGLGPTKDDTTRQSLSDWMKLPLELNQEQWTIIQNKLNSRQLTIRPGHQNQALIPKTAIALANSKGVAPGFFVKASSCFLASLPGPPNELQPMFETELKPLIIKNLAPRSDKKLQTWICLGAPESEVAHIVESVLGDEFPVGYRLQRPYVEVKVWVPVEPTSDQIKKLEIMEKKLHPWFVAHSASSIREDFLKTLEKYKTTFVIDHLSSGIFLEKMKEQRLIETLRYQCFEHKLFRYFSHSEVESILRSLESDRPEGSLFLSLFPASETSAYIGFNNNIKLLETPRGIPVRSELGQSYIIEKCFLEKF